MHRLVAATGIVATAGAILVGASAVTTDHNDRLLTQQVSAAIAKSDADKYKAERDKANTALTAARAAAEKAVVECKKGARAYAATTTYQRTATKLEAPTC